MVETREIYISTLCVVQRWWCCEIASSTDNRSFFSCDSFSINIVNKLHVPLVIACCLYVVGVCVYTSYSMKQFKLHQSQKCARFFLLCDFTIFCFIWKTKNQHLSNNGKNRFRDYVKYVRSHDGNPIEEKMHDVENVKQLQLNHCHVEIEYCMTMMMVTHRLNY